MVNKVIFEGIDGSGKTTLLKELVEKFNSNGIKALYVDEIEESPISDILKKMLSEDIFFRGSYDFNTSMFETLLLAADNHFRNQYIADLVEKNPDLEYVFFDRDFISVFVYQTLILEKKYGTKTSEIKSALEKILTFELPFQRQRTYYVYVNTPIEICVDRVQKRDNNRLSLEEIDFLNLTKIEFLNYFAKFVNQTNISYIDGSLNVKNNIEKLFKILTTGDKYESN